MTDVSPDANSSREAPSPAENVIEGVGVAPGIAIGGVYHYQAATPEVVNDEIKPSDVTSELDLFEQALQRAKEEIETARSVAADKLDPAGEAIFEAQEMMLKDEEFLGAVRRRVREEHESAAYALVTVLQAHRRRLEESDDEYLRERANDLEELQSRLLQAVQQGKAAATIESNSIVLADRLTAADVVRFSRHGILGLVMGRGGRTSHVSIIARALNLPAVVGAHSATDASDHDRVILDGLRGRLIVHPTADTLELYRKRRAQHQSLADEQDHLAGQPAETTDGHRIRLRANVEFGEALDTLDGHGAEGIGLMRTEMLFLGGREGALTEDEQTDVYRQAAEATGEHGATVRLLDLGGDKLLPSAQQENNPFLGWRGIRVLLDRPEQFLRPQIRALLRANAKGSLRVLLPMVAHLDEVRRVQSVFDEEADRLDAQGVTHDPDLPLGVMVEVPSVALQAQAFAEIADFLSIGTNDLTQYVLAVDRGNDLVADRYDALHPAVLGLVKRTVEAGQATNTTIALCGEIASDASAVPILVGLGLHELSVASSSLPVVKGIINEIDQDDAAALAEEACSASDAVAVRRRAREWLNQYVDADRFSEP
jgi:phosphotransferase system enzyme I (PtsI)